VLLFAKDLVDAALVYFEHSRNFVLVVAQRRQLPADDSFGPIEPMFVVQAKFPYLGAPA